jgi:AAA domain-containing protein/DeoR-like protein with HTH domain
MTLEELAAKFRGPAKRAGHQLLVFCPIHEDSSRQSLALSQGDDGRLLTHCYAGCATEAVLAAVSLHVRDLFLGVRNGHHPPQRETVAVYPYVDGAGALLYQVVRFAPKDFRFRQPDGRGGWMWNLEGIRRVPYRLPDLVEQVRVFWCEGEKDADRMAGLGLPATTAAGGANAWRDEYADQLAALGVREVVVLPDNDAPGKQYAAAVALACRAKGLDVHIVLLPGLPPKGDLSDWLDAGHKREEIEALIAAAKTLPMEDAADVSFSSSTPFAEGAGELLAREFPPVEVYVESVLTSEGSGFIAGEEKLGKTYYALAEAFSLSTGLTLCGRFPVPVRRRVLLIEEEDSPRRTQRRLRALARGSGLDPDDPAFQRELSAWLHLAVWAGFRLDSDTWLGRLDAELAAFPAAVVYLDVLRKLTARDLNKQAEASALLDALDECRRRRGCLFRVLHHYRKNQGLRVGRGSQELGGSYVLSAWAEQSVFLEPVGRKGGGISFDVQRKDSAAGRTLRLRWESEGPHHDPVWVRLHLDDVKPELAPGETHADQILQLLQTLPPEPSLNGAGVTVKALAEALKISPATVRRTLRFLVDKGLCAPNGAKSTKHVRYSYASEKKRPDEAHPENPDFL